VICSSDYVRSAHGLWFGGKATTIAPGVDPRVFRPGRCPEPGLLLFVGSLRAATSYKGLDVLLTALVEIRREIPGACLEVVGDGDRRAAYEELARLNEFDLELYHRAKKEVGRRLALVPKFDQRLAEFRSRLRAERDRQRPAAGVCAGELVGKAD
jgi:glycosyltransferase involved in cell wall biosynthesis